MRQREKIRSIILNRDAYERAMEELHKLQAPGVYSGLGKALGWNEQPVPPYLTEEIMKEIRQCREEIELDRRVMFSGGFLLLVLLTLIILTSIDALNTLSPVVRNQAITGFFWMVTSLVGSGWVLFLSLLRYQQKDHSRDSADHPLAQIIRYLRLKR
ncbi:MAG TPA: hypothetical protein GXZ36_11105 [Firmicutes bacterium]|nr:hypothetical protein [Bacillota bacterium]